MNNNYITIAEHYKQCFEKHGATPQGLDWSNQEDMNKRYEVMYELVPFNGNFNNTLLDFGCGYAGFYNWIYDKTLNPHVKYTGLDINEKFIRYCNEKYHPNVDFWLLDIHNQQFEFDALPNFDYIILNGVFTVKRELTYEQMFSFMSKTLQKLWTKTNKGIAFNLMSKHVDWERNDLFHVGTNVIGEFFCQYLSRNFIIRNDYGLYEYTVYCYK